MILSLFDANSACILSAVGNIGCKLKQMHIPFSCSPYEKHEVT